MIDIFRHTKMLIIKRKRTNHELAIYKKNSHNDAILGHKRRLLMDSKNKIYGQISHSIQIADSI